MDISDIQMMFAKLDDKHGLQFHLQCKMNCRIHLFIKKDASYKEEAYQVAESEIHL